MTTANDMCAAISRRHGLNSRTSNGLLKGALVREVGINLFADRQHYADVIVQEYTGDRRLIGYEVKVSRGDWLRELAQLSKAAWWAARCDEWWLATTPNVVKYGEVPKHWGHLELKGNRLYIQQQAEPGPGPDIDAMRSVMRKLHHTLEA